MAHHLIERTLEGYKITRIGRGMYECVSHSRPEISYPIDLLAHGSEEYGPLGHCECEDFLCRRYPRWKKVRVSYDHFRCRHIRAVRNHVMNQILKPYSDMERGK